MSKVSDFREITDKPYCCSICGTDDVQRGGYWMGIGAEICVCTRDDCIEHFIHLFWDLIFDKESIDGNTNNPSGRNEVYLEKIEKVFWLKVHLEEYWRRASGKGK